jgi:hypothetical protein
MFLEVTKSKPRVPRALSVKMHRSQMTEVSESSEGEAYFKSFAKVSTE